MTQMLSWHSDICKIPLISLFLSLPPSLSPTFFLSSFLFLSSSHSFSFGGCVYAVFPKQKEFASLCRTVEKIVAWVESSTVHFKAFHSTIWSGDCFHASVSKCCLNAIALSRECIMLWELQIGLPERDLACRESRAPTAWEATTSGKLHCLTDLELIPAQVWGKAEAPLVGFVTSVRLFYQV